MAKRPTAEWNGHFSATQDLLRLMAKEREIIERHQMQTSCLTPLNSCSSLRNHLAPPTSPNFSSNECLLTANYGLMNPDMLTSRERFFDSLDRTKYNSEGDASDLSDRSCDMAIAWDDPQAFVDGSFRDISMIPSHAMEKSSLSEGPLHSTLLQQSATSSLYLEDVHVQNPITRRMDPIGEEAEPTLSLPDDDEHLNGSFGELTNPSVFMYSMAVHQGSAPSTPVAESPRKLVTFNSNANVQIYTNVNIDVGKGEKEKVKKKKKKGKKIKCLRMCTSADRTYISLAGELPPGLVSPHSKRNDNTYEEVLDTRPPCVGKEATPCTNKQLSRIACQTLNSPSCISSHNFTDSSKSSLDLSAVGWTKKERRAAIESIMDSDASVFMQGHLNKRGVTQRQSRNTKDINAHFKTLALV